MEQATVLKTVDYIGEQYELSFLVKPLARIGSISSILHATTGKNKEDYGSRVPALWFHDRSTKLHICSPINNEKNSCVDTDPLPINKYSKISITQTFIKGKSKEKFFVTIVINGKTVSKVENTNQSVFSNVILYGSDRWYVPAQAQVKGITYRTFV